MGLQTVLVTVENFEQLMWELFEEDNDFNGNNGRGYTSDEATEKGFSSDLQYAIETTESFKLEKRIDNVARYFKKLNKGYYDIIEYDLMEVSEGIVFSIIYKN